MERGVHKYFKEVHVLLTYFAAFPYSERDTDTFHVRVGLQYYIGTTIIWSRMLNKKPESNSISSVTQLPKQSDVKQSVTDMPGMISSCTQFMI